MEGTQQCTSRKCQVLLNTQKRQLKMYEWMHAQLWKTQSYAGELPFTISQELEDKLVEHPAMASFGLLNPGLLEIRYLKQLTDEATLRKELQLLPTDIVKFVGVDSYMPLTQE